ncbi:hypothetical protein FF011L_16770 [Roseimaritima multifibrata]|uniref:Uncharacterized protein n=1 Tax=Roseimaritima multifibrata TaxID=1930274 RepID=A0A517MDG4_9BACT|nr:hypothetical protein FF011L_16770 [Roseimaritima multifibrata]
MQCFQPSGRQILAVGVSQRKPSVRMKAQRATDQGGSVARWAFLSRYPLRRLTPPASICRPPGYLVTRSHVGSSTAADPSFIDFRSRAKGDNLSPLSLQSTIRSPCSVTKIFHDHDHDYWSQSFALRFSKPVSVIRRWFDGALQGSEGRDQFLYGPVFVVNFQPIFRPVAAGWPHLMGRWPAMCRGGLL